MISLLCPTRGRPLNAVRMAESAQATADGPLEFVFRTDDDDPSCELTQVCTQPDVKVVRGPRTVLSSLWNECYLAASADICMQCDDEVIFRSPGWDTAVKVAFGKWPDKIVFVHGRDGHQVPGTFGTLGFLHRRWVETVGYFTPPYFSCDYGDTWLNDVANMLGRRIYLPEVFTEHMHPAAGKSSWDDLTHQERLARGRRDNAPGLYLSLAPERTAAAEKLGALLGTPA